MKRLFFVSLVPILRTFYFVFKMNFVWFPKNNEKKTEAMLHRPSHCQADKNSEEKTVGEKKGVYTQLNCVCMLGACTIFAINFTWFLPFCTLMRHFSAHTLSFYAHRIVVLAPNTNSRNLVCVDRVTWKKVPHKKQLNDFGDSLAHT